ncbi:MAG: Asp23/Gls24 family envelope stress response protein [Chloroflexota bacterium]|nr:Asp23/Gls24 family envelope stress response protein [Chloroflexota bacterium]
MSTSRPFEPATTPGGKVEIANSAIATIVHEAVLSCYGIVDLAPRSLTSAIGRRLGVSSDARGIRIDVEDNRVSIELSVVMEYGIPIFTVASNVMEAVKFQVERVLGMDVERVNVNVDGLHISQDSGNSM